MNKYIYTLAAIIMFSSQAISKETHQHHAKNHKKEKTLSFFQKERLNDPIMSIDFGTHRALLDQHIYQIREGSKGGYSVSGGNCGCN